ncbi:MAG: sugar ABC transporter permease [Planctomycetota bacterium]
MRDRRGITGYIFASPWLVGFFLLMLFPMIASLLLSMVKWNGISLSQIEWVGAANYARAFGDDNFRIALWNTAYYSFIAVPLGLVVSLLLAMLLNQKLRGISIFRTIFYMPHVIGGVATIMMWMWVFNPDFGLLNAFLRMVADVLARVGLIAPGWDPPQWLYDPKWSKPSLILMSLWGAGGAMLIFLAALQNVPEQLYEAARIDGAGRLAQFWHVTMPQISPAIFFNLVMGVIGSFQVFDQAYIMTGGGPARSTLFYVLYLYQKAFEDFEMGYASALAWILFVIIFAFTMFIVRSSAAWVYYEGETK